MRGLNIIVNRTEIDVFQQPGAQPAMKLKLRSVPPDADGENIFAMSGLRQTKQQFPYHAYVHAKKDYDHLTVKASSGYEPRR